MTKTILQPDSVSFDIAPDGTMCVGVLTLHSGILQVCIADRVLAEYTVWDYKELRQIADFGAGSLELIPTDPDAEAVPVCRYTMTCAEEASELCKAVNYCISEHRQDTVLNFKRRHCPKCGRTYRKNSEVCMFCADKTAVFKRALQTARPYYGKLLAAGFFGICASVLGALYPIFYGRLTDSLVADSGEQLFNDPIRGIWILAGAMLGAKLLSAVASLLARLVSSKVSVGYADTLRRMVYDSIQRLSVASVSRRSSGDLMKRVTQDTDRLNKFFTDQGRYMVEQVFTLSFVLVVLFVTDWRLTLLTLLPVPLAFLVTGAFSRVTHMRYDRQWRAESKARAILHDIIRGIRVVKTFGAEEREIGKFSAANHRVAEIGEGNEKFWALLFQPMEFVVGIGEFLVLLAGGRMVLTGSLTLGCFVRFVSYLSYIYGPLRWFSRFPRWLSDAATRMIKIFEIVDEKPEIFNSVNALEPKLEGRISFEKVNFGYKSYVPVLKNVSFDINPGEMIGIVGPSGVGKSTVINLVMRLYDPDSGVIRFDGIDHREIDRKTLHDQMGAVFQETFLFSGTVFDNIAYGSQKATAEQVIAAAKAANAHDFIMRLPDGYNSVLGEDGHDLSGGERQRIAIARAILKNPKILILDEATSALDPETEEQIQQALENLTKNRTTIAIAHRLATLRHADRLFVFENGTVSEVGSHNELLKRKGMYYRLVMAQRQTAGIRTVEKGL